MPGTSLLLPLIGEDRPRLCWRAWNWLMQQAQGGEGPDHRPFTVTLMEKYPMPPAPQTTLTHAALGILGAIWVPIYYYSVNMQKKPSQAAKWKSNAKYQVVGSLIPAPLVGMVVVPIMANIAPWVAGDYRFEWFYAFVGGTGAVAFVTLYQKWALSKAEAALSAPRLTPRLETSAPQGEEMK